MFTPELIGIFLYLALQLALSTTQFRNVMNDASLNSISITITNRLQQGGFRLSKLDITDIGRT